MIYTIFVLILIIGLLLGGGTWLLSSISPIGHQNEPGCGCMIAPIILSIVLVLFLAWRWGILIFNF